MSPSIPNGESVLPGWVHRVARSRAAVPVMGLLSFLDACVSPVMPELLMVPLVLSHPRRRFFYAAFCSVLSVAGAVVGYLLGAWLWEAGLRELAFDYIPGFSAEVFADVSRRYGSAAFLWVFLAAFTPLPYKVFTVAAGMCHEHVDVTTLLVASVAGRFPRFFLEGELIHHFGPVVLVVMRRRGLLITVGVVTVLAAWYFFLS